MIFSPALAAPFGLISVWSPGTWLVILTEIVLHSTAPLGWSIPDSSATSPSTMTNQSDPADIDTLLERSAAFELAIQACFPEPGFVLAIDSPQHQLVATACVLCTEHASVLRAAFAIGLPNSGSAVLRLQYEALLRAAWLMYAATPAQVEKLSATLDFEAEQAAKKLPGYLDMMNAVTRTAPAGLSAPLAEFNQYSRHALNSFVHSGIHPLYRARTGCPAVTGAEGDPGTLHRRQPRPVLSTYTAGDQASNTLLGTVQRTNISA